MPSFKEIKGNCPSRNKYADGGRVSNERKGGKTVINIVTPQAGGMPVPAAPPAAPMGNSPSPAGPPVPPAAAAMALGQMQGKPGAPGAFARGGRVKGGLVRGQDAGAGGGKGRLQKTASAKRTPVASGKPAKSPDVKPKKGNYD